MAAQGFQSTFPLEPWNVHQQTCGSLPRTNNGVDGFHSVAQSSATIRFLVSGTGASVKEGRDSSETKGKCDARRGN